MKTTKTIEYPIKDMVSFEDRGDGTWRLHCPITKPSHREYLYPDNLMELSDRNMKKRWGELDYQINKFIEEDGRFIITYESYWDEYRLPKIVFPNPNHSKYHN